jgi:hypothetical protein
VASTDRCQRSPRARPLHRCRPSYLMISSARSCGSSPRTMTGGVAPFRRACRELSVPNHASHRGQAAGVAACVRLGADHCERSAQVRGCPAVCAAVVTQLDTRSRPDAVVLAPAHTAPEAAHGRFTGLRRHAYRALLGPRLVRDGRATDCLGERLASCTTCLMPGQRLVGLRVSDRKCALVSALPGHECGTPRPSVSSLVSRIVRHGQAWEVVGQQGSVRPRW